MPSRSAYRGPSPSRQAPLRPCQINNTPAIRARVLTFARRPPPGEQLRKQKPVAPRDGRNAIGSEAFLDDPPLYIHAEPAASASVHDLEELEIILGRIAIHTTCNQIIRTPPQGGLRRMLTVFRRCPMMEIGETAVLFPRA